MIAQEEVFSVKRRAIEKLTLIFGGDMNGFMRVLIFIFKQVRMASNDIALKKHRQRQAGLVDFMNYASVVEDGVVILSGFDRHAVAALSLM